MSASSLACDMPLLEATFLAIATAGLELKTVIT